MVVDDSIVVLESIAKARERGLGILQSAIVGASEVRMAVVASTLTTVAVFFPLVFVEGVAGQLFGDQALTVTIAMVMSMAVAMTLIPMLSSLKASTPLDYPEDAERPDVQATRIGRWRVGLLAVLIRVAAIVGRMLARVLGAVGERVLRPYGWLESRYVSSLPWALRRPAVVLVSATFAFVLALAVLPTLGLDLIPQLAQGRFEMTAKLPAGTPLAETDAMVRSVQLSNAGIEGVHTLYGVSGSGTRLDANPTESGENIGKLTVVLAEGADAATEARATEQLRAAMQAFPSAEVKFARPQLFSFRPHWRSRFTVST